MSLPRLVEPLYGAEQAVIPMRRTEIRVVVDVQRDGEGWLARRPRDEAAEFYRGAVAPL